MAAVTAGDYVKLHGLSKAELNGRLGFVQNMDVSKGRYNVILREGRVLALKADNLGKTTEDFSSFSDVYLRLKSDWNSKAKKDFFIDEANGFLQAFQSLLPPGTKARDVLMGFLGIFLALCVTIGLLKALILSQILFAIFIAAFPAFKNSGGGIPGLKAAGKALNSNFQTVLKTYTGQDFTEIQVYGALGVLTVMLIYVVFLSGNGSSQIDDGLYNKLKTMEVVDDRVLEAYKQGYSDSKAGKELEESYENFMVSLKKKEDEEVIVIEDNTFDSSSFTPSFMTVNRIIPLAFAGKMLFDLGGGTNWNYQTAWSNFINEPLWKKVLMIFAFARMFM